MYRADSQKSQLAVIREKSDSSCVSQPREKSLNILDWKFGGLCFGEVNVTYQVKRLGM